MTPEEIAAVPDPAQRVRLAAQEQDRLREQMKRLARLRGAAAAEAIGLYGLAAAAQAAEVEPARLVALSKAAS